MVLRPLAVADLELARSWRNAPHVRAHMAFQEEITVEMHQRWWEGLHPDNQRYWIFSREKKEMGMVHLKDIDWQRKVAEAGVWTADPSLNGSPWPVMAVLAMMAHAFEDMGLLALEAKVRGDHAPILAFNQALGYQYLKEAEEPGFIRMWVQADDFWRVTAGLRAAAERLA